MPRSSKKSGSARKRNKPHSSKSQPTSSRPGMNTHAPRINEGGNDIFENEGSMGLLNERDLLQLEYHYHNEVQRLRDLMRSKDKAEVALLIVLYLLQGILIGLASGTIPFLLKSKPSYSELGMFSLAAYPYSLRLLWSPVVDSVFNPRFGRRKSWIVPLQFVIGSIMLWMSPSIQNMMDVAEPHVGNLTVGFTLLMFLAASHGIAVDGWALALLSHENLSYASVAQTIGVNTGYFLSFTVFLTFNDADFANKYLRTVPSEIPLLSLGTYLKFWGSACVATSLGLLFFKSEYPVAVDEPLLNLGIVRRIMWDICKLKHVRSILSVHMIATIGFQVNNAATSLKLAEKGFSEDLALVALINLAAQILGGWYAASWTRDSHPLRSWLWTLWVQLGFALARMGLLYSLPDTKPISSSYFCLIILFMGLSSFISTVQYVSMSAFHSHISDPLIGGTYMTLLNTAISFGGAWPRYLVLKGVEWANEASCLGQQAGTGILTRGAECMSQHGKEICAAQGGTCVTGWDGYYTVSCICIVLSACVVVSYVWPIAEQLQDLGLLHWRVHRIWDLFVVTYKVKTGKGKKARTTELDAGWAEMRFGTAQ